MNPPWMTTFISKIKPLQVIEFIEKWSPRGSKEALGYVLDVAKPFLMGLGFRISKLTETQIEIVIPYRQKSLNDQNEIHESILLAAGLEAVQWIWIKQFPVGQIQTQIQSYHWQKMKAAQSEQRVRYSLEPDRREIILSNLRLNVQQELEATVCFFDENEQLTSELYFKMNLIHQPLLESTRKS